MKKEFKVVFIILILFLALFLINNFKQDKIHGKSVFDVVKNVFSKTVPTKIIAEKQNTNLPVQKPYTILNSFGSFGSGDGQFRYIVDLAVSENFIYVLDINDYNGEPLYRVQKFDLKGNFILKFGSYGPEPGQFMSPSSLDLDSQNNVYVLDTRYENKRIQKFDSNGFFINQWSIAPLENDYFSEIVIDSLNKYIYLTAGEIHSDPPCVVYRLDLNANYLNLVGDCGDELGQFMFPISIDINSLGDFYVSDLSADRIQRFDLDDTPLERWGSYGSGPGQFQQAFGLAIDSLDYVYVAERLGSARIQKFDKGGRFITQFYTPNNFTISNYTLSVSPSAIDVDLLGKNVYVASSTIFGYAKILVYSQLS
ncbi:MAG: 6-bladed beta-propeller [Nanoarchaeota archaeon]